MNAFVLRTLNHEPSHEAVAGYPSAGLLVNGFLLPTDVGEPDRTPVALPLSLSAASEISKRVQLGQQTPTLCGIQLYW